MIHCVTLGIVKELKKMQFVFLMIFAFTFLSRLIMKCAITAQSAQTAQTAQTAQICIFEITKFWDLNS